MNIAIIGTGYVGLVTGACLSEIGHTVTCIDIDEAKVQMMKTGNSPIYEPGLDELMLKNIKEDRLFFTTDYREGLKSAEVIYLAVGTPQSEDGSANLTYIKKAVSSIAQFTEKDAIVVTKSTVPVGTNDMIQHLLDSKKKKDVEIVVVSNPEFLREGSAIYDTFNGDRIVIGSNDEYAAQIMEEVYYPFNIPVYHTDIRSAEMIKYSSNAFLATKISFINEIANLCERMGANIEDVSQGMGLDSRIGPQFLRAGIGYGGSCFPKDTHALVHIADQENLDFALIRTVIKVNEQHHIKLFRALYNRFEGNLEGKSIAILGLAFKPNTDDMREAPSIPVIHSLLQKGANVYAYDPIAVDNAQNYLPYEVNYCVSIEDTLKEADAVMILTDWDEFKEPVLLDLIEDITNQSILLDGRNCFDLDQFSKRSIEYYSVGRQVILPKSNSDTFDKEFLSEVSFNA